MTAHVLFGIVAAEAVPVLRVEALRLAGVSTGEEVALLAGAEARLDLLCPTEAEETRDKQPGLAAIHGDLRSGGLIGRAPFAAFLTAPLADPGRREVADVLCGWLVLAALERPLGAGLEARVVSACDAVRLLKRIDADLLEAFDLRRVRSFDEAQAVLRRAEQEAERTAATSHRLLLRLRPVRALMEAVARDRAPIARGGDRQGVETMPRGRGPSDLDLLLDVDDAAAPDGLLPDPLDTPRATNVADAPAPVSHVARQERRYDMRARDRLRTRAVAAAAAMRDLQLPASADLMTDHEARVLLAAAREAPQDAALTALALSLLTGRSIERLIAALEADPVQLLPKGAEAPREAWDEGSGGASVLEIAVSLPGFAVELPRDIGRGLCSDGRERLRLALPQPFDPTLLLGLDLRLCDRAIGALRDRVARPYARTRVTGWLGAWLRNRGADPAAIGTLTGQDPGGRAQMHYTRLDTAALSALWEEALADGLGVKPPPRLRSSPAIGSRMQMPEPALARAFAALGGAIDRDREEARGREGRPLAEIAAQHDRFALYTLELLGMSTGHRPVDAPFERLDDIDLETGIAGIADKAISGGRSERIVTLPPSAVAQIGLWAAHLRALHGAIAWRLDAATGARIAAALETGAGAAPLFFFLTPEGGIVEPLRREIASRRRSILPVQANLARHMLRTRLVAAGVAPDAIDATLGHARLGEEPWGVVSTLSLGDLRAVADAAEGLLRTLCLTPRPGPLQTAPASAGAPAA